MNIRTAITTWMVVGLATVGLIIASALVIFSFLTWSSSRSDLCEAINTSTRSLELAVNKAYTPTELDERVNNLYWDELGLGQVIKDALAQQRETKKQEILSSLPEEKSC